MVCGTDRVDHDLSEKKREEMKRRFSGQEEGEEEKRRRSGMSLKTKEKTTESDNKKTSLSIS